MKFVRACISALLLAPLGVFAHGDVHLQILEVTQRIEKDPKNAELYLKRGELHRAHQDWDAAYVDYEKAITLNTNMAVVDLVRGKLFLEANWPLSSIAALDRFLAVYTNHVDALVTRARSLVKLGRFLEATKDYTHSLAVASAPQPEVFLERAQALTNEGSAYFDSALQGLDEGLKRLGPLPVLQISTIEIEVQRKHFDAALARLDSAAARAPRKETWLERRGDILLQAGRSKEAAEAYQQALQSLATLPPARRQVPATLSLEQRLQANLKSLSTAK